MIDADKVAFRLQNQIIFGWLYLRYHLGGALAWADEEALSWLVDEGLLPDLTRRLRSRAERFWPPSTRPDLQLIDLRLRPQGAGFLFRLREAEDNELSQALAPGAGYLEVLIEVVDSSAWRLIDAYRVPDLAPDLPLWDSDLDPAGGVFLTPAGRQVVAAADGALVERDELDEVPPRYRVQPESGQGRWYWTPSRARAEEWARHHSGYEDQRYLVYDRESLQPAGALVAAYADGARVELDESEERTWPPLVRRPR